MMETGIICFSSTTLANLVVAVWGLAGQADIEAGRQAGGAAPSIPLLLCARLTTTPWNTPRT